jgi:phage terminase small subunit
MATKPRAPSGLGSRGGRFWRTVVDTYELQPDELELLAECCRTLDDLDKLRKAIGRDGTTVAGSKGQTRTHPALAELRQTRLALGRLLGQLGLPDPEDEQGRPGIVSPLSARGRKAARARWGA